jgi:hypothetical protein
MDFFDVTIAGDDPGRFDTVDLADLVLEGDEVHGIPSVIVGGEVFWDTRVLFPLSRVDERYRLPIAGR